VAPPEWTIVAANDARLRVTGTTGEEQIGRRLFDVFPDNSDDPEADGVRNLTASFERVLATKSSDTMAVQRYSLREANGQFTERWWAPVNTPVFDDQGEIVLIIHQVEDVSEVVHLREDVQGRDQLARTQQIVIDRMRASEAAHRDAEERYLALFNAIDQAFCTIEVAFDDQGRSVDYRFLELSPSFERQTGIENGAGRWMREIARDQDQFWFDIYGRVALTGEPARFENYSTPLDRWFDVYAFRISGERRVAVLFRNTTDHKYAEQALRQSEARLAFLDRLGAETASLASAGALLAATTRLLGEHLNLSVCAYADMDEDQDGFTIRGDWAAPGSTSIVGHYSLAEFGQLAVKNLKAGLPLIVNDNLSELAPEEAATFQSIGLAATVCMPLVKQGRLTALIAVHDRVPRVWTEAELSLLREVTARSWAHVERVRAVAALRESEARFRLMADAVPQIVWITDAQGRTEFFNKQWSDYIGARFDSATAAEVAAAHVHAGDAAATMAAFDEARRTGTTFRVEHRIKSKTGTYRWFLVRGEPYRDPQTGEIIRWFGASVDIHDRKIAEEQLRDTTRRLNAVLDNASVSIFLMNDQHQCIYMNPASERLTGYSLAETQGRHLHDVVHHTRPDGTPHPATECPIDGVSPASGRQQGEEVFINREGRFIPVAFAASAVRDEDGAPVGTIVEVQDISERKAAEAGLRDLTDTLERRVRERTAELVQAQEALRQSQKLESMGQLTGGVAHDFNNLLTPIVGSLDMLQRKGLGGAREQRLIEGALQSAERAKTLVQRLLAFARRQPLQPKPVDLGALVSGMADLVASTIGPQIKVVVDIADDLPAAVADPNQIEMAILNLSVNARDAMEGGGTLRISAKSERAEAGNPSQLEPGPYVCLSVADTGFGMDEATLARAVEPFFSTKGVGRGTGLGLSMVHGLAAQLGGALTITSRQGFGTNVEIWLPASGASADQGAVAEEGPTGVSTVGTALLVDDEVLIRMSTADMLSDLGYKVVEAGSGEEALRLVDGGLVPDLLVTDHLMPGIIGTELVRELRARRPDTPVLVVSGYSDFDGIAAELPRLVKPFRQADLTAKLRELGAL
jgi:PAS domain S-box-containing protein